MQNKKKTKTTNNKQPTGKKLAALLEAQKVSDYAFLDGVKTEQQSNQSNVVQTKKDIQATLRKIFHSKEVQDIVNAQKAYKALGDDGQFISANQRIIAMENANEYSKEISKLRKSITPWIIFTENEKDIFRNLIYAGNNHEDTTAMKAMIDEELDGGRGYDVACNKLGLLIATPNQEEKYELSKATSTVIDRKLKAAKLAEEKLKARDRQQAILAEILRQKNAPENVNKQQNLEEPEERKEETKFVAQPEVKRKLSTWGEKQKSFSRTSLIQSNEERKEQPRLKREGSVHSKSRINIGGVTFDETRTGKGRSTSREFSIGDKVIEGKHLVLKRVASQPQNSISSSLIPPEDQIKKREASLNKKFGGMSFGK